jgi:hypothetical protein
VAVEAQQHPVAAAGRVVVVVVAVVAVVHREFAKVRAGDFYGMSFAQKQYLVTHRFSAD